MVSGGVLVEGHEIRLGALTFIADDSAWLQEAPLDIAPIPVRVALHFRVLDCMDLLRQPSAPYRSTPVSSLKELCPRGNNKVIIYFLTS